jgi:hypothetical protein
MTMGNRQSDQGTMKKSTVASIGLRAKTGRALAVVLAGTMDAPQVVRKLEIRLDDPRMPATSQPYHEVMEMSWEESQKAVRKSAAAIGAIARKALRHLIDELQAEGIRVNSVGVVGSADRDLAKIGNYHIRAHAAEGVLFRRVLDEAADANGLKRRTFSDRDLDKTSAAELGPASNALKRRLNDLGRTLPPPWRADEKQAATAAWLALHRPGSQK